MDAIRLTWLGQAGFLLETGNERILIDPFLSDYAERAYPPPDSGPYLEEVVALLVTHDRLTIWTSIFYRVSSVYHRMCRCSSRRLLCPLRRRSHRRLQSRPCIRVTNIL